MEPLKQKIRYGSDRLLEAAIRYFDYYPERKAPAIAAISFLLGCLFALVVFPLSYYLLKWFWVDGLNGGAVILFLAVAAYAAYVLRVR